MNQKLILAVALIVALAPIANCSSHSSGPDPAAMAAQQKTPPQKEDKTEGPSQPTAPAALPPPPPPPPPSQAPPPQGPVPYEQAFPEDFKRIPPVRIGILSSPNRPAAGQQFALMLSGIQRQRLEFRLRKPIKVAFVSRSEKRHVPITQIRYRPEFLHAAVQVAGIMPYQQSVAPMSEAELKQEKVDILVYVGASVR